MSPFSLSSSIDNMVKRFFPAKKKKRLIVFNVETTNLASLNRAADQASEIQHCSVSKNFKKTNLTAICVYDFSNNSYIFFDDENYRSFEDLIASRDIVVGFDSISRGQRAILENWGIAIPPEKHFDLLVEIVRAARHLSPNRPLQPESFSLRACCTANFLSYRQSVEENDIPRAWQNGRKDIVFAHCRATVQHINDLLAICMDPQRGFVNPARPNQFLQIPPPDQWQYRPGEKRAA